MTGDTSDAKQESFVGHKYDGNNKRNNVEKAVGKVRSMRVWVEKISGTLFLVDFNSVDSFFRDFQCCVL